MHPSAFLPLARVLSWGAMRGWAAHATRCGAASRLTWGESAALLSAGAGAGGARGLKRGNVGGRPCALLLTARFWAVEVVTVWGWLAGPQVSGSVVSFVLRKTREGLPGAISEPPAPRTPPVCHTVVGGPAPPSFPSLLCESSREPFPPVPRSRPHRKSYECGAPGRWHPALPHTPDATFQAAY